LLLECSNSEPGFGIFGAWHCPEASELCGQISETELSTQQGQATEVFVGDDKRFALQRRDEDLEDRGRDGGRHFIGVGNGATREEIAFIDEARNVN
jgi:hypothetical protein